MKKKTKLGDFTKLKKTPFGREQSPRTWFKRFIKTNYSTKIFVLIVYVDDIIIIGDDNTEIMNLKKYLKTEFKV